jgi:tryptophan halogenase
MLARFYHYWLKMYQQGKAPNIEDYSINTAAARQFKFMRADRESGDSPLADISHAFHFDASLYAKYLRRVSEAVAPSAPKAASSRWSSAPATAMWKR